MAVDDVDDPRPRSRDGTAGPDREGGSLSSTEQTTETSNGLLGTGLVCTFLRCVGGTSVCLAILERLLWA